MHLFAKEETLEMHVQEEKVLNPLLSCYRIIGFVLFETEKLWND